MLLIVHNLPFNIKYSDLKALILSKCGLSEVLLDRLTVEGKCKRVTVGLSDEEDAALFVRKINGLFLGGQQLYVENVRQRKESEQPYRTSRELIQDSIGNNDFHSFNSEQQSNDYQMPHQNPTKNNFNEPQPSNPRSRMGFNTGMGGYNMPNMPNMPAPSTYILGFGGQPNQQPQILPPMSEVRSQQEQPLGFRTEGVNVQENRFNDWRVDDRHGSFLQHPSNKDTQRQSPPRRPAFEGPDGRMSSRDEHNSRSTRHRSRSPPRGNWDSRARNNDRCEDDFISPEPIQQYRGQEYQRSDQQMGNYNKSIPEYTSTSTSYPQNIFGSHVTTTSEVPNRYQPRNDRDIRDQRNDFDSFQSLRCKDIKEPRGVNQSLTRYEPKSYRGRDNQGPRRQSKPFKTSRFEENWRDEPKVPPKRFLGKSVTDGPQSKRFAAKESQRGGPSSFRNTEWSPPPQQQKKTFKPRFPKTGPFSKNNPRPYKMKDLRKDRTWRGQAASTIVKDMFTNLNVDPERQKQIMSFLKKSIKARFNVLFGGVLSTSLQETMCTYREKFPESEDQSFFAAVLEEYKKKQGENAVERDQRVDQTKDVLKEVESVGAPVAPNETTPEDKPAKTIPNFPVDRKTANKERKELKRQLNDGNFIFTPEMRKALDEETDILCDLFMGECLDPANDEEKLICEQITDAAADDFRKVIRVQLSRRLLRIEKHLALRIYFTEQKPEREAFEKFLKKYGVTSVRKSDRSKAKMYIAVCNTFKNFDALCALGTVQVGGSTVNIKPIHLTGEPVKLSHKEVLERRRRFIASQVDNNTEDILKPSDEKSSPSKEENADANENKVDNSTEIADKVENSENVDDNLKNGNDKTENIEENLVRFEDDQTREDIKDEFEIKDENSDDYEDYENIDEDDLEDY